MELKATRTPPIQATRTFQSHLYGIESSKSRAVTDVLSSFQSHLYGIERSILDEAQEHGGCFNRTFMELKEVSELRNHEIKTFQSHLYGIESIFPRSVERRALVSIAPLWN